MHEHILAEEVAILVENKGNLGVRRNGPFAPHPPTRRCCLIGREIERSSPAVAEAPRRVPKEYRAVLAPRGQHLAVGGEGETVNRLPVPGEGNGFFTRGQFD